MKITVDLREFRKAFSDEEYAKRFSWEGLEALFNYLEGIEEATGTEIELDAVALCDDYTEYQSIEEFRHDYGDKYQTLEDIEEETAVIPVRDGAFIIQNF